MTAIVDVGRRPRWWLRIFVIGLLLRLATVVVLLWVADPNLKNSGSEH
jgi:hypothetical protein